MTNHLERNLCMNQDLPQNHSIGKTLGSGSIGEQSWLKNQVSSLSK